MLDFTPKLICFDLNKTIIRENTWYELNLALGVTPEEDKQFLAWYDSGDISYREGQKKLEKIYKERGKADKSHVLRVISKYSYRDGARETIAYLQSKGYHLALISGSIDLVVERVASELKIEFFGAHNRLLFDDQDRFTGIQHNGDDADFKVKKLSEFCSKLNISLDSVVCVGDGYNDRKLFEITKHGVTFTGSEIESLAWKKINGLMDLNTFL